MRRRQQRQRYLSHLREDELETIFLRLKTKLEILEQIVDIFKNNTADPVINKEVMVAKNDVKNDIKELQNQGISIVDIFSRLGSVIFKADIFKAQEYLQAMKEKENQVIDLVNEDRELYRRLEKLNRLSDPEYQARLQENIAENRQRLYTNLQDDHQGEYDTLRLSSAEFNRELRPPGDDMMMSGEQMSSIQDQPIQQEEEMEQQMQNFLEEFFRIDSSRQSLPPQQRRRQSPPPQQRRRQRSVPNIQQEERKSEDSKEQSKGMLEDIEQQKEPESIQQQQQRITYDKEIEQLVEKQIDKISPDDAKKIQDHLQQLLKKFEEEQYDKITKRDLHAIWPKLDIQKQLNTVLKNIKGRQGKKITASDRALLRLNIENLKSKYDDYLQQASTVQQ